MNRSWLYVLTGAFFEVVWVSGLKHSEGPLAWAATILGIYISFHLLIKASRKLPVGTVYAVFTGLGTAGTVLAEWLVFGEPLHFLKVFFILLLLTGVFGLKFVTGDPDKEGAVT
ncbi:multidrug efflux SMR transporter [Paenibacillus aurantius]|uniref:Multidrug efflux SMR transporter n=1 Tax=Paenibacillus aurantius TaxID=2918900 RepID=A0AA96RFB1_9BACL|nr:multidrug efflux SMR transporter [Paenibacillus aurantius]WJH35774.1 multidrug efflux SMR transporter [Paenibacillus sp. CC-CFT747]WNQ11068.1 multidrug efflux SMR transporter [Paenibacillus aurantius]